MRIHIIGGSGIGKTYISKNISNQLQIPHYDLDDIYWDNESDTYGTKMPIEERTAKLNDILKNDNWVIEGVFYSWLSDSFMLADYIFILNTNPIIFNYRILKRFIKRKLGIEKSKKETLKSLKDLIVWTNKYQKNNISKIISFLEPYQKKVFFVDSVKQVYNYINIIN